MSKESNVALGIAAAALAGLAIGILVAPSSGEETRGKIRKGTNKLTNRLIETLESGRSAVSENVDAVTEKAKSAFNQAKGMATNAKHQAEDLV